MDGGALPAFELLSTLGDRAIPLSNLTLRGQIGVRTDVASDLEDLILETTVGLDLDAESHQAKGLEFTSGVTTGVEMASGTKL